MEEIDKIKKEMARVKKYYKGNTESHGYKRKMEELNASLTSVLDRPSLLLCGSGLTNQSENAAPEVNSDK